MYLSNTHIHSPHSFSAFGSIEQAVRQAQQENVRVLGLSDFNTVDGYTEFDTECRGAHIHPLFNIEFIALSEADRDAGHRWNDPQNPGTIYFCGKALAFPVSLSEPSRQTLDNLWIGSQKHMRKMIARLNTVCADAGLALRLDYDAIKKQYARNTVRERHLARALADGAQAAYPSENELIAALQKLVGDPGYCGNVTDSATLQNDLRSRLLKSGKPAFVAEDSSAFLPLATIMEIILDGGGIPCYPILADDSRPLNEREQDPAQLAQTLLDLNIHAVEFIPIRNSLALLERYVPVLLDAGMCVTFGTEHNTPVSATLVPQARKAQPLSPLLEKTAWEGACLIAAHQALVAAGKPGYVDRGGTLLVDTARRAEMVQFGAQCIVETVGA